MANGDIAAAAGMEVVPSTAQRKFGYDEINKTRDYIKTKFDAWVALLWPLSIARGGTGKTTAKDALVALGGWQNSGAVAAGSTPTLGWNGARLTYEIPGYSYAKDLANFSDLGAGGKADGPTSEAYNRGPTGSNYFTVWMNDSLQFFRNTSSRRYKTNVRDWAPDPGAIKRIRTVKFDRIDGDPDEVGFIAEEILEAGLPEAVVYFDGEVDGISDRVLLAAVLSYAQDLERRIERLETEAQL